MSWEQLDMRDAPRGSDDNRLALMRGCKAAMRNEAFAGFLRKLSVAASYTPSRSSEETAYYEGIRAMAVRIITLSEQEEKSDG